MNITRKAEMTPEEAELYVRMLGLSHPSEIPKSVIEVWSRVKVAYDRLVGGVMPPVGHLVVLGASGELPAATKKDVKTAKKRVSEPEEGPEQAEESADDPAEEPQAAPGPADVGDLEAWAKVDPGTDVIFKMNGQFHEGRFIRVMPYGALMVEDENGRRVDVGPAEVRRRPGRKKKAS